MIALDQLVEPVARTVIAHTEELTRLDQAIGDGDHGLNMKRGCEAVLEVLPGLADAPIGEALKTIGMTLVMKIGGASGPLYGTLAMELGKALGQGAALPDALGAAIAAVGRRGKSEVGQKTMLDVLVPVHQAISAGASLPEIRSAAAAASDATIPMQATKGRASFLGERSIGHMDPGARSSALIIDTICQALETVS